MFARRKKKARIIGGGDDDEFLLPLNEILLATVLALNNYQMFLFTKPLRKCIKERERKMFKMLYYYCPKECSKQKCETFFFSKKKMRRKS